MYKSNFFITLFVIYLGYFIGIFLAKAQESSKGNSFDIGPIIYLAFLLTVPFVLGWFARGEDERRTDSE